MALQRTTKNSMLRAGFELASSGFLTAALQIELWGQLHGIGSESSKSINPVGSVAQLVERQSRNPKMRVHIPLETTNFLLFSAVLDYYNSIVVSLFEYADLVWGDKHNSTLILAYKFCK